MNAKAFFSQLGGKLGVGLCFAGFLFLFLGWNGAASVDRVASQFPYLISGGLVGLSLVVIGVGMIVVQNQRADRAALQATLQELQRAIDAANGNAPDDAVAFALPPARPTPQHVVDTIAAGGSGATDSASRRQPIEIVEDDDAATDDTAHGATTDDTAVFGPPPEDPSADESSADDEPAPAKRTTAKKRTAKRAAPKKTGAKKAASKKATPRKRAARREPLTSDDG